MNIVLASASPRRASLLKQMGLDFLTIAPEVDEQIGENEAPDDYVQRVALEKATVISQQFSSDVVIAADTVVVLHGEVLGKAHDRQTAQQMLSALNDQRHKVLTALAMNYGGQCYRQLAKTVVTMAHYDQDLLDAYLDSGDWQGKAGACSLQGRGGLLIDNIEGDLHTVVGLPLADIYQGLVEFGFKKAFLSQFAQPLVSEEGEYVNQ